MHLAILFSPQVYQTLAGITQAGGVANPLHQRVLIQFKLVHSQMQGCKVS